MDPQTEKNEGGEVTGPQKNEKRAFLQFMRPRNFPLYNLSTNLQKRGVQGECILFQPSEMLAMPADCTAPRDILWLAIRWRTCGRFPETDLMTPTILHAQQNLQKLQAL